jgi:hypothetical protein
LYNRACSRTSVWEKYAHINDSFMKDFTDGSRILIVGHVAQ